MSCYDIACLSRYHTRCNRYLIIIASISGLYRVMVYGSIWCQGLTHRFALLSPGCKVAGFQMRTFTRRLPSFGQVTSPLRIERRVKHLGTLAVSGRIVDCPFSNPLVVGSIGSHYSGRGHADSVMLFHQFDDDKRG